MNKEKQNALRKYPMKEQLLIKVRRLEEQNEHLREEIYKLKHGINEICCSFPRV